jgi:hypothetical protein
VKGFDDPEVMAAVAEVAANPAAFAKHAHKPGVRAFYAAMAGVAGDKLERVGEEKARGGGGGSAGGGSAEKAQPATQQASPQQQRPSPPPPPPAAPLPRCVITELD